MIEFYIGMLNDIFWFKNEVFHNANGYAVKSSAGRKEWFTDGNRHRLDGPLIEYATGKQRFFIHDNEYTELEYWIIVQNYNNI